jgi:hypothetical protein
MEHGYCHFVNKKNKETYNKLCELRSVDGKTAFSAAHRQVLSFIGSFDPEAGCFATNETIMGKTCNVDKRTFRSYLAYLVDTGAVVKTHIGQRRVLRIGVPTKSIVSQKDFRCQHGVGGYARLKRKDFILKPCEINHPPIDAISPSPGRVISPPLEGKSPSHIVYRGEVEEILEQTPPQPPPPEEVGLAALDREAALPRPQTKGCALREGGKDFFEDAEKGMSAMAKPKKKEFPCEPLESGDAKRKNTQERVAEAIALHNRGHIVNPLGKVDNRGRRLYPERARPIGETGEPTDAQLYRFLHDKFEENGWHGVFVQEMLPFRDSVAARLADLRQKFMETCGCQAKNRTLYEYFRWFLDPSRLDVFMASAKRAGRDYPAWQQMCGTVYLRRFYESEIKNPKARSEPSAGKKIEKIQDHIAYLQYAYDRIRKSENSELETVRCLRDFGIVMYAQYLHDQRGLDGSEAKQSVIGLLTHFLNGFEGDDRAKGAKYLSSIAEITTDNEEYGNDNSVWPQWKETSGDIVKTSLERAGYNVPKEAADDANEEERRPGQVDHPADEVKA